MPQTQQPLAPVFDFLSRHAPFDQMAPAHLEYLAKRLRLGFYACNEVVVSPDEGVANRFYIIKQGRIRGETRPEGSDEGAWELVAGECFPIGALLSRRPVRLIQRAAEETFCFELEREDFEYLLHKSAIFHDFCTRRIANLLDKALRNVHASSAHHVAQDSLNTPLRDLIRRKPITCLSTARLQEALHAMREERVGSIFVVDDDDRPLGLFTLHDLLARVALPGRDLATPIAEVMTPHPITLPADTLAAEAARVMTEKGVGHLGIVSSGRLVGVVSERDLFSVQRVGLVNLSQAIAHATTIDSLAALERDIHRVVEQMLAQGASVAQLTQILTTLNDTLTQRVIALILQQRAAPAPFAWVAFGSEGRFEQTLRTDQDNGIVFEVTPGETAESLRQRFLPIASEINRALAECGFPLCRGNIMARNPDCCLSLDEWRGRFSRWIDETTPDHMLNASLFFDLRHLYGEEGLTRALREHVARHAAGNGRFLHLMTQNALRNTPPLGIINNFQLSNEGDRPHTLDLKMSGLIPFVDAARVIALAHAIGETSTVRRLQAAAAAGVVSDEEVAAWAEAYHYIQLLRMRAHRQQAEQGMARDNRIDPDTLHELDRRILKEAFRQARKLQTRLRLRYSS